MSKPIQTADATIILAANDDAFDLQLLEHAHELAMSRDPVVAARGRYLKAVAPAFIRFIRAELDRPAHDMAERMLGLAQGIANEIITMHCNWTNNASARCGASVAFAEVVLSCVEKAVASGSVEKAPVLP